MKDDLGNMNIESIIDESYNDWVKEPTPGAARQIARTAFSPGYFSIDNIVLWKEKFRNDPEVLTELNKR